MSKVKFELPKDLFLKKKKKQNKIMNAFSKKTCKQLKKNILGAVCIPTKN